MTFLIRTPSSCRLYRTLSPSRRGGTSVGGASTSGAIDNFPDAVAGADALHSELTRVSWTTPSTGGCSPLRPGYVTPRTSPTLSGVSRTSGITSSRATTSPACRICGMKAVRWCRDFAGQRVHGTTRSLPLRVFQDEERHALAPRNGEPYEVIVGAPRKFVPTPSWPASTPCTPCRQPCSPVSRTSSGSFHETSPKTGATWYGPPKGGA